MVGKILPPRLNMIYQISPEDLKDEEVETLLAEVMYLRYSWEPAKATNERKSTVGRSLSGVEWSG